MSQNTHGYIENDFYHEKQVHRAHTNLSTWKENEFMNNDNEDEFMDEDSDVLYLEEEQSKDFSQNTLEVRCSWSLMNQVRMMARSEGVSVEDLLIEFVSEGVTKRVFENQNRAMPSHLMTRNGYVTEDPQTFQQPQMSHHAQLNRTQNKARFQNRHQNQNNRNYSNSNNQHQFKQNRSHKNQKNQDDYNSPNYNRTNKENKRS